jgi:hypothetical protein
MMKGGKTLAAVLFALFNSVVVPNAIAANFIGYGGDFVFTVKEPAGWIGECCSEATTDIYHANAVFYRVGETALRTTAPIRIVVFESNDGNTDADLA